MSIRRVFPYCLIVIGVVVFLFQASASQEVLGLQSSPPPTSERLVIDDVNMQLSESLPEGMKSLHKTSALDENFEGAWPAGMWQVSDDSNNDGGEFLWAKSNCRAHGGQYSAWVIGGGSKPPANCDQNYPNNVNTWAVYGPVDFSDAVKATLIHYTWGKSEVSDGCTKDFFFAGSSTDEVNFRGGGYCGNWTQGDQSNEYYKIDIELDRGLGEKEVFIGMSFESDGAETENGFFVDDVLLSLEGAQGEKWFVHLPLVRDGLESTGPTATPITPEPTITSTPVTPEPTNTPIPTKTTEPGPKQGSWKGTTNRNQPMSFDVVAGGTEYEGFTLKTRVNNGICTGTIEVKVTNPSGGPIIDDKFELDGGSFSFSGQFTSPTKAEGDYEFSNFLLVNPCGFLNQKGTWKANP